MDYQIRDLGEGLLLATITGSVAWSVHFLAKISRSIGHLNTQIATMLERMSWHGKELSSLDKRVTKLEDRMVKGSPSSASRDKA